MTEDRVLRIGDRVHLTPAGHRYARRRRLGAARPDAARGVVDVVRGRQVYVFRRAALAGIALWWPASAWERDIEGMP